MDTRRFRDREQSVAAFRWLGWVTLMMFVLVQTVHVIPADIQAPAAASASTTRGEPAP